MKLYANNLVSLVLGNNTWFFGFYSYYGVNLVMLLTNHSELVIRNAVVKKRRTDTGQAPRYHSILVCTSASFRYQTTPLKQEKKMTRLETNLPCWSGNWRSFHYLSNVYHGKLSNPLLCTVY